MKLIWIILPLIFLLTINAEKSFADDLPTHDECVNMNNTKNILCDETFRPQSVSIFSVVDSSVGIFEDPDTKLPVVDLGTFYGIGGNGTIPDVINVYRDSVLWKTTTKETGIAPSTSHSEWQLPQTFFFNELPGKYKLVLVTNDTETLVYEFLVIQITKEIENDNLESDVNVDPPASDLAPLKQVASGILPDDILCKENLQLIFKITDNSPACVSADTAEKLIQRGWAKN
ncbi:hypothetical protein SCCGRSA3_01887 [Marine Group I thaumarchaeote SCGC RSA3]|uniref:Uncharacterized protein n=3 Tax=Marine Group I TaxID=905826 RepID=A0A081RM86_9ARCH|nr:hypothetical protein AAA799N04_01274 [Marine Group I thaumarchaeote SCGC AAA799-N04]KFM15916.1 hypothetical protein AAA799D11_01012 [Marine Group I thaumarchaeote SCGC AAA799-D11]KFM17482.1 hypothetical protein SCCGRSA3_01887 [Marine Group I thaumarchaeote SCGC RSA3]